MTKSTRVTNVQVPGAAPTTQPEPTTVAAAVAGAVTEQGPSDEVLQSRVAAINTPSAANLASAAAVDLDAMRDQIRHEERAKLHDELSEQMRVAASVVNAMPAGAKPSKHDYRNMRAADIDPATLTAPVMTLDGYLCPPAPEAKK